MDFQNNEIFTFHHGAVAYELREMFEAGELEGDVNKLQGRNRLLCLPMKRGTWRNNDRYWHLIWLHAPWCRTVGCARIYPMEHRHPSIADSLLDEENQE